MNLLHAGTTGKLAGKITDENNKIIPFANIQITELQMGVQADAKGNYILRNITPGIYEVIYSQISYQTHQKTGANIVSDETTILNVNLSKQATEIEGIQVSEARTSAVDRLKTSSGNPVSSELIEDLKIQKIEDIVALQAGVQVVDGELHIRGGTVSEVAFMIDGISVNNVMDGRSVLTLDIDAIRKMKVMTGGFPAEYGNAQSGIISIITKDGSTKYRGKIEVISDHLISKQNQNYDHVKFSITGPVIPSWNKKLTFFLNYSCNKHDSEFIYEYAANAGEELLYLDPIWSEIKYYDPFIKRDKYAGFDLDDRLYNFSNGNMKINYKISPIQKLAFSIRNEENTWQPYNHRWRYALEHYKKNNINNNQFVLSYENVVQPNMIINFSASHFQSKYQNKPRNISSDSFFDFNKEIFDLYGNNHLGNTAGIIYNYNYGIADNLLLFHWRYYLPELNQYNDILEFMSPAAISPDFIENYSNNYTLDFNLEWQVNPVHDLKSGINFVQHDLKQFKYSSPWELDLERYNYYISNYATPQDSTYNYFFDNYKYYYPLEELYVATLAASGQTIGYKAKPWQLSWYLQDKMEWEGLVINAGLRLDMWHLGNQYMVLNDMNKYEKTQFKSDERLHYTISPRLRVSHVISSTNVLHFAYNRQSQIPQMQFIYPNASWHDTIYDNEDLKVFLLANPNLKPPTTTTSELGLQHQFNDNYIADLTIFYKSNYNYVSLDRELIAGSIAVEYNQYKSGNYGRSSGLDFNLQKKLSNFIFGSLSYTLGWTKGTDAMIYDYFHQDQDILLESSSAWDSRHNLSLNIALEVRNEENLILSFTDIVFPLDDFSINLLYNFASGTPITDIGEEDSESGDKRKSFTDVAHLSFTKGFILHNSNHIDAYCKIENLFDKRNIDYAYINGSANYDGANLEDPGSNYTYGETQHIHDLYTNNPDNMSFGRRIICGLSYSW